MWVRLRWPLNMTWFPSRNSVPCVCPLQLHAANILVYTLLQCSAFFSRCRGGNKRFAHGLENSRCGKYVGAIGKVTTIGFDKKGYEHIIAADQALIIANKITTRKGGGGVIKGVGNATFTPAYAIAGSA